MLQPDSRLQETLSKLIKYFFYFFFDLIKSSIRLTAAMCYLRFHTTRHLSPQHLRSTVGILWWRERAAEWTLDSWDPLQPCNALTSTCQGREWRDGCQVGSRDSALRESSPGRIARIMNFRKDIYIVAQQLLRYKYLRATPRVSGTTSLLRTRSVLR
jgi:hypothetical protein